MKNSPYISIIAITIMGVLSACDSGEKGRFVNEPLVLSVASGHGQETCGPDVYPCGPYGSRRFQTVRDVPFVAVNEAAQQLGGGALAYMHDFYELRQQGYKLLFVQLTTGWCTHCREQMHTLPQMVAQYGSGSSQPKVAFLVVVREDPQLEPATVAYAAEYSANYGLDAVVPVTNDAGNAFLPYMTSVGYPFNFYIQLSDMTILDYASALETPETFSADLERVLQIVQ